jgi:transposase
MQTRRNTSQSEMMLLPSLEEFVPLDDPLRRLKNALDLSFIHEIVRPLYCQDNGRPSIDPEVVIRLFILQAIKGIKSVRQLLRDAHLHMGYRWFIGYSATESLPDHSALSKILDRFGDDVFDEIFRQSIAQCKSSGLIEGRILHIDATTIRADIDKTTVEKENASDADARFGRFPDGTKKPGYKQQTVVDNKSRVVLAVDVKPANEAEGCEIMSTLDAATEWLDKPPEALCADSGYASGENKAECEARGIRFVSPPRKVCNHHSKTQFTIEQFVYDEKNDVFVCPAGKILKQAGSGGNKPGRWKYRASAKDCGKCPLKTQCTKTSQRCVNVGTHHGALVRLREDSKTSEFAALYRRRAPIVEGVFAEAKQWHGLARAWWRGRVKVRVQCLLIASVLNMKRLAGVSGRFGSVGACLDAVSDCLMTFFAPMERFCRLLVAIWTQLRLHKQFISAVPPAVDIKLCA